MTSQEKKWKYKNDEEEKLAKYLIGLEEEALKKYFKGDMSGYKELCSKTNFSYFDDNSDKRIDEHKQISDWLDKNLEGKMHAEKYDIVDPRVQFGVDMGILTYQLFADTNFIKMEYNVIEVFQKESDGVWRVIHSTWDKIKPYGKDHQLKEIK